LEHLQKDAGFRNKVLTGDAAANAEFNKLNEMRASANATELAIAGYEPPSSVDENSGAVAEGATLVAGAAHLTENYGDIGVREILNGVLVADDGKTPLSIEEAAKRVGRAENYLTQINRSAEFRRQLLSGNQEHRNMLDRLTATIVAGRAMIDGSGKGKL
jgi:hypothetical protein